MLTDTKLRSLKPRDKVFRLADSNGLCVEVRPAGTKFWRYRYRYDGKASMLTLGEYPLVTLAEARTKRDMARAQLQAGTNPAEAARLELAARRDSAENSFAVVANELLQQRSKSLSEGTVARERRMLEKDLGPVVGDLPVDKVTAPLLLKALRKVESRGAVETAHRCRAAASRVFRYAIATGRMDRDPATDLSGALSKPQASHFAAITDPDEFGALLRALYGYQGSPAVQAALKLAPLWFVRPGELRHARWEDLNMDKAQWHYFVSKTQTWHIVPLATQALEILDELRPHARRSEYLFPGQRTIRRPLSENAITVALRTLGYGGDVMTGHGFRATARTMLDEQLECRLEYIEHQLAHTVRDALGRAYNRTTHLRQRSEMMQRWADYLDHLRFDEAAS